MPEFKKEDMYLVIKREELEYVLTRIVPRANAEVFNSVVDTLQLYRKSLGKEPLDCVIAKKGTPEYDEVWRIIEESWQDEQDQIEYERNVVNVEDDDDGCPF